MRLTRLVCENVATRSSSGGVRIRVPAFFAVVDFSRGPLPTKKGTVKVGTDRWDPQLYPSPPPRNIQTIKKKIPTYNSRVAISTSSPFNKRETQRKKTHKQTNKNPKKKTPNKQKKRETKEAARASPSSDPAAPWPAPRSGRAPPPRPRATASRARARLLGALGAASRRGDEAGSAAKSLGVGFA